MKPARLCPALLGVGMLLVACSRAPAPAAPAAAPPPEVSVLSVHPGAEPVTRELVGRLAATRVAEVRARVAGVVLQRVYVEGSDVDRGQLLFRIDPAPLQADLHAREAALARARADAANARQTATRYRDLVAKHSISQQDLDAAEAAERSTAAAVRQAEAEVERARLDLGYAQVTAPIAGRAGRAQVTEGALVGEDEATLLTTVEQIDPVYVNFSQSASEWRDLQSLGGDGPVRVRLRLPDGSAYPQSGTLDFADQAVDPATGAVSLRALVPNPEHRLLPGMFVRLRLVLGAISDAVRLPQAAVARDAQGAYVLVVEGDGKVARRSVHTREMTGGDWIVTGDLADGDQVIVEGLQKVQPGSTAKAVPQSAPDRTAATH